jgi:hypothetical protein
MTIKQNMLDELGLRERSLKAFVLMDSAMPDTWD